MKSDDPRAVRGRIHRPPRDAVVAAVDRRGAFVVWYFFRPRTLRNDEINAGPFRQRNPPRRPCLRRQVADPGPRPGEEIVKPRRPESVYSEPNIITLVRLSASLVFFALAVLKHRELYNFIGLGIHWFGDVADGWYARTFKQETVLGAEIDIIADRVETLFFFVNFIHFHPGLWLPVVVYVLDFAFVDFYLSYQFVKYDIISINYFAKVDRRVYALNFSPPAKFCNSTIPPLILILLPRLWVLALAGALTLIAVKVYSISLLWKKRTSSSPSQG
jgi:CDP-diacylglycerol--glycerol-3-phosphate 3-phosphatidyltransferase